jgi:hypothetical protein
MTKITLALRLRILEGTIRMLGRAVDACIERLLEAGMDAPAVQVLYNGDGTAEHRDTTTERLLVLQLLDKQGPRSHTELRDALSDIAPTAIYFALKELEFEDVLYIGREKVWASDTVRHLDKLELIGI